MITVTRRTAHHTSERTHPHLPYLRQRLTS
jgi:hypothetical protein